MKASLRGSTITHCDFSNIRISRCDFTQSLCKDVDFSRSKFSVGLYDHATMNNCDFTRAYFHGCIFMSTCFKDCSFRKAHFEYCKFINCTFDGCDLGVSSAPQFHDGEIRNCYNVPPIPMTCPEKGEFTGYKKARVSGIDLGLAYDQDVIVELKIPEEAKRSSALGRKCRCSEAEVVAIYRIREVDCALQSTVAQIIKNEEMGEPYNFSVWRRTLGNKLNPSIVARSNTAQFLGGVRSVDYKVGEKVYPDSWNSNRFEECSHGIHFFISAQEAVDY